MTDETRDDVLRDILRTARTFACLGVSTNPVRPSYFVARYLVRRGYRVIPINPAYAGATLFGAPVLPDISSVEEPVDVLDVFRRPEAVPGVVSDAIAKLPGLKVVWLQLGIVSPEAERLCAEAGISLVQDRCPKIEYQRLFGELRRGGFVTGIISSRL